VAKLKDIASDIFNIAKGIGLSKPATGDQQEFSLDKFMGKMQERNSLARANRYVVRIAPPQWALELGEKETADDLVFFCDNVNYPGTSIIPVDIKRQGLGTFDRRPSNIIADEVTASFMLDNTGRNLNFFHKWAQNIVNMDESKGPYGVTNNATFGEIQYRARYTTTMEIEMYDQAANLINRVKMFEVWPSQISPVTLGWAQNDEYARVQVNFQQRYYTIDEFEPTASDPRQMSAFEQLLRIGQSARALKSSFKTPNNVGDVINVVSNTQTFLKALGGKS